jgi:hypothetical protein
MVGWIVKAGCIQRNEIVATYSCVLLAKKSGLRRLSRTHYR